MHAHFDSLTQSIVPSHSPHHAISKNNNLTHFNSINNSITSPKIKFKKKKNFSHFYANVVTKLLKIKNKESHRFWAASYQTSHKYPLHHVPTATWPSTTGLSEKISEKIFFCQPQHFKSESVETCIWVFHFVFQSK